MPKDLKEKYGSKVPYDVFFPKQQDKVEKRVCKKCKMYFSTVKSLQIHRKECKVKAPTKSNEFLDSSDSSDTEDENNNCDDVSSEEEDLEVEERPKVSVPGKGGIEVILDLKQWLKSPWSIVSDCT